jgi:hypothetical protein
MSNSEQLEREAEQCRAQITATLAQLRGRMTPGRVMDQVIDYARASGGAQFARNLQRQVVQNPLPLTLMGAGLAWLMMGSRADGVRTDRLAQGVGDAAGRMHRAGNSVYDKAGSAADAAGDVASGAADMMRRTFDHASDVAATASDSTIGRMRDATARVRDAADSTSHGVRGAASSAYESAADTAARTADGLRDGASSLRARAAQSARGLTDTFSEQPLVLAGIGLVIGATIGALLPMSKAEDKAMGEASEEFKSRAQDAGRDQFDRSTEVAEHAYQGAKEAAKHEAEDQGAARAPEPSGQGRAGRRADEEEHESPVQTESPALVPTNHEDPVRERASADSDHHR